MTAAGWTVVAERGSVLGMRLTVWVHRTLGRRVSAWFILPIVAYFFVTDRAGRRQSRRYLRRLYAAAGGPAALGRRPGAWDSFLHYRAFALTVLDRLRFALGEDAGLEVVLHGRQHFDELLATRRGAVLLGAHLGSFDALRALARRAGVVVNVVMSTRHAPRINATLRRVNPAVEVRVVHLDPASPHAVFRLRACVDRGEFVAILGDRAGSGARAPVVRVPFLGVPAPFPPGPFLLAHALGCPVLLVVALRRGPAAYEIFAEPLADRVDLPRAERAERLRALVSAYAARLEAYCLRAPHQWFNFYDFWGEDAGRGREVA